MLKRTRLSSIELLRIIAIIFILTDHVLMVTNALPSAEEIRSDTACSLARVLFSVVAVGGVDIFILISGWFGIHPKARGVAKYIYEVFFLLWLVLLVFAIANPEVITVSNIRASLGFYNGYWFIMAYLGLYLLSPILNAFVENVNKRQFFTLLCGLYLFQAYYSWLSNFVDYYSGYSITLFCTLYLTARYIRLYPAKTLVTHPCSIYAAILFAMMLITTMGLYFTGTALRMLRYDNPLVIALSICMIILFSKWNLRNKFVNKIAMSCFAVYIIHFNPLVFPYFSKGVLRIWNSCNGVITIFVLFGYLCIVFLACFLIDQLRIATWNMIIKNNKIINQN